MYLNFALIQFFLIILTSSQHVAGKRQSYYGGRERNPSPRGNALVGIDPTPRVVLQKMKLP